MSELTRAELERMKNTDIRTVKLDDLVDIRDVNINTDLSENERILDFIKQIRNPYCFKCGDVVVKVTFGDLDECSEPASDQIMESSIGENRDFACNSTLEERFENYLKSL